MTVKADFTVKLFENQVEDQYSQENFKRLKIFLRDTPVLKAGFVFQILEIPGAVTDFKVRHNLLFQPKDVIMTSVTNGATITWKYDQFDRDFVVLDSSAKCTIRVLLGVYKDSNT